MKYYGELGEVSARDLEKAKNRDRRINLKNEKAKKYGKEVKFKKNSKFRFIEEDEWEEM